MRPSVGELCEVRQRETGNGNSEGLQLSRIAVSPGCPFPPGPFLAPRSALYHFLPPASAPLIATSVPAHSPPSFLPAGINGKSLLLSFKRPATLLISNFGRYLYLLHRSRVYRHDHHRRISRCTRLRSDAARLVSDRRIETYFI
ncbi:hypothetical protein PUN28_000199 [Cardiocondyla obscurior]|uniref:Uncharacterized protein n=1 Tax=Cardiocondyla obscurior TaxID=286306 RepID=A0AAW2GYM9_9HYME